MMETNDYHDATRGYIPEAERECIEQEVERRSEDLDKLAIKLILKTRKKLAAFSLRFFILFRLIAVTLGLTTNALYEYLEMPRNATLRAFLEKSIGGRALPARSWLYRRLKFVDTAIGSMILRMALEIRRAVNETLCLRYLNTLKDLQGRSKEKVAVDKIELLRMIDFSKFVPWKWLKLSDAMAFESMLRAVTYMYLAPLASFNELVGNLKAVHVIGTEVVQWLSVRLGFLNGPPGKTRMNKFFDRLDINILRAIQRELLCKLIEHGLVDTIVVSLDSTCIAAQKGDPDKKEGGSSRGPFDGFKLHVGISNGGMPIYSEVTTGEKSDGKYLRSFLKLLARLNRKYPWLKVEFVDMDAAYDSLENIREVEKFPGGPVPVIDINPGRSRLLNRLKKKGDELAEFSKKALDEGGLNEWDRETYEALHAEVEGIIETIRREGTPSELAKAFNGIVYASIAWFMVYRRRAVVEGVFGIMKKLLGLLGRRQKQTRFKGLQKIRKHCLLVLIGMSLRAIGKYHFTERTEHLLKSPHNWTIASAVA